MKTKNVLLVFLLFASSLPMMNAQQESEMRHDGIVFPRLTTSQRNATSATLGMVIYNTSTSQFEYYNGSSWGPMDTTEGGSGAVDEIEDATDGDTFVKAIESGSSDYIQVGLEGTTSQLQIRTAPSGDPRIEFHNGGTYNIAVGNNAGDALTSGTGNVFLGELAGSSQTTANDNVFIGYSAGYSSNAGFNTMIGRRAGYNHILGVHNTFLGHRVATNGNNNFNTIIGSEAMENMDSASPESVVMGSQAAQNGDQCGYSVILGHQAGQNINDGFNVLIGHQAGQNAQNTNQVMKDNVIIGYGAGQDNNGNRNVYLGKQAGSNNEGDGNVFIGNNCGGVQTGADNELRIANNSTTITDPLIYGEFDSKLVAINNNSASAHFHIKQTNGGEEGLAIENNGSGDDVWAWEIGTDALILYYDGVQKGYWHAGTGEYIDTSDKNLKTGIEKMEANTLSKLNQLNPSRYFFKDDKVKDQKAYGLIAQEVKEVFPDLVSYFDDGSGVLAMNYTGLTVIAVKAIQEQQVLIDDLTDEIEKLKKREKEMMAEWAELKASLSKYASSEN